MKRRQKTRLRLTLQLSIPFLLSALILLGCGSEPKSGDEGASGVVTTENHAPVPASSTSARPKHSWPDLAPLSNRVEIYFALKRVDSSHVRMDGTTNLPPGTHLMTLIKGTHERYGHSAKVDVQLDGSFTATYERVRDGQYRAEVLMPILLVQPQSSQKILGKNAENVRGPLREQSKVGVVVRREADLTIRNGTIVANYRAPATTSDATDGSYPKNEQWAEWMSDNDLEQKREIYSLLSGAWAAADKEARRKGLLAKRERLSQALVNLDELDKVEQQIEEIEERKFRELAKKLDIPFHYLRAINMKGASLGW